MLLLKEHGVCGYLKDELDHCCIHIPNVTQDVEHDLDLLGKIKKKLKPFKRICQKIGLGKFLKKLGWNLSFFDTIHNQNFVFVIVFLMIMLVYICLKKNNNKTVYQ